MFRSKGPTTCTCCCGEGPQCFTHCILRCKEFQKARDRYLPFLEDLYAWLSRIINQTFLTVTVALDSEKATTIISTIYCLMFYLVDK